MTGTLLLAAGALAGILLAFALATWLSLRNVGHGGPAPRPAAHPARPRRDAAATEAADPLPSAGPRLRSVE